MKSFEELKKATGEYGVVTEVRHPIVAANGLPGVKLNEVVFFDDGERGRVMTLDEGKIEIMSLSDKPIGVGQEVVRTGERLKVPVGEDLRGKLIDPLGRLMLDEGEQLTKLEMREIETKPWKLTERAKVARPLETGTSIVDMLMPLGAGQRQAVLGDQKTGKTLFLLSTMRTYAQTQVVVYAAIGKPWKSILDYYEVAQAQAEANNIVMVGSRADDTASSIVLTPFTAMTVAEYFRDKGHDVMVIFDDLSTQAIFYRELALLARRFPGRESYPGDIFYLHARLLERGGNFKRKDGKGEVAITCLAGAETVNNDLTGYIVSNLISITDGHLLFDSTLFGKGQRPAIDHLLSVTRVGRQTMSSLQKKLSRDVGQLMAEHSKALSYTQFGAELSSRMQEVLDKGNKLLVFFSQPPYLSVPRSVQILLTGIILYGWLDGQADEAVGQWRDRLIAHITTDKELARVVEEICQAEDLDGFKERMERHKEEILTACRSERA